MSSTPHTLRLDAEALYTNLLDGVRRLATADTALVGVWSGGAWLAERLARDLGLSTPHGVISSALHRDDFGSRGMSATKDATHLPFEVEGRHILLIDDVLYTGRTTRAALNELFDYGRPAAVALAVLADRGGRELPIGATYCVWDVDLQDGQSLVLGKQDDGRLVWRLEHA